MTAVPVAPRPAPPALDAPAERPGVLLPVAATGLSAAAAVAAAAAGPALALLAIGAVAAAGLVALVAWRPVLGVYAYLATLPIVAGIDRGTLLPLLRPNEALLAVVLTGAGLGAYLRWCRGDRVAAPQLHGLDAAVAGMLLVSTAWPIATLGLRGTAPTGGELAAILPVAKLAGLYVLVRLAVTTGPQLVRCIRCVVWPGAVVAVVAVLQTLQVGPVVAALAAVWSPDTSTGALTARGTTTLASPIATGDYVIISLILVICCGAHRVLGARERVVLGAVLGTGVLAAGQFSTWISALVAGALVLRWFPQLRRRAVRFLPLLPLALVVGAPALVGRLSAFGETGVPQSWLGRWDNLTNLYLPRFRLEHLLTGVSPDPVLPAPETWREVVYLESGYLQFLWIGGVPLLVAFGVLAVSVLRRTEELTPRAGALGATASALQICWWFLLVLTLIDPHLTLRGTGDLLFTMLAIMTGRLGADRD